MVQPADHSMIEDEPMPAGPARPSVRRTLLVLVTVLGSTALAGCFLPHGGGGGGGTPPTTGSTAAPTPAAISVSVDPIVLTCVPADPTMWPSNFTACSGSSPVRVTNTGGTATAFAPTLGASGHGATVVDGTCDDNTTLAAGATCVGTLTIAWPGDTATTASGLVGATVTGLGTTNVSWNAATP